MADVRRGVASAALLLTTVAGISAPAFGADADAESRKPVYLPQPKAKTIQLVGAQSTQAAMFAESRTVRSLETPIWNGSEFIIGEILNLAPDEDELPSPLHKSLYRRPVKDGALYRGNKLINAMPASTSFEGISNLDSALINGGSLFSPPDTNGDVGPNHYVQSVNIVTRVFSKSGAPLTSPFKMSQLFASLGQSFCATQDNGDPIVLYDQMADRWMISQFAIPSVSGQRVGPFHQCIAISKTGDPTGSYYVYDFVMPKNALNDYPHFGVWPNAYFMADHQFNVGGTLYVGEGVFAFDRTKMLVGDPTATYQYFDLAALDPSLFGVLPSDNDGGPAPAGSPNLFVGYSDNANTGAPNDSLRLFNFTADFTTPANSTFVEQAPITVADFNTLNPTGRRDVPQPPPSTATNNLDSIGDRMLNRIQYRNFGSYESVLMNHTVNIGSTSAATPYLAAPRYYELRRTPAGSGSWVLQDQLSYGAADGANAWMGSVAQDKDGNVALGFSASSAAVFPQVRYAGRLATDPLGTFAQGEATMVAGTGTQRTTSNRWGDYSSMNVDPVDECTFWFTTEYYNNPTPCGASAASGAGSVCWQTRIGSFKYPSCAAPAANGFVSGKVTDAATAAGVAGATVVFGNGITAITDAGGFYNIGLRPGSYTPAASRAGYTTTSGAASTVTSNGNLVRNIALPPLTQVQFASNTLRASGTGNNGNGTVDADECLLTDVALKNTGFATATGVSATLSTTNPAVTVTQGTSAFANIPGQGTSTNATPFGFSTSAALALGTPINFNLAVATAQGPVATSFTVPTGTASAAVQTTVPQSGPVTIDSVGPNTVNLAIPVSGLTTAISKVTAAVKITHSFVGDLTLTLIGPDGSTAVLSDGRGGAAVNFGNGTCPATAANATVFDDAAANSIAVISVTTSPPVPAPFVASFRPETPLSVFVGKAGASANGTWTLRATDSFAGDGGTIDCVTLTINGYTTTSPQCSVPVLAPTGVGAAAPSSVAVTGNTLLTVATTSGQNPASTGIAVSANLSAIGGSSSQAFVDNGTQGDVTAGDGTFSYTATLPLNVSPGAKSLTATVSDAQTRSSTAAINLTVLTPTAPTASGTATPNSAAAGATSLLAVTVTGGSNPASSGLAATVDLSSIGGSASQALFDDGSNGDVTGGDGIYSFLATVGAATATGPKVLPVSVTDGQGRSASTAIALNVPVPGNPSGIGVSTPTVAFPGSAVVLQVSVSPGSNPASTGLTVTVDTTAIGGSTGQTLHDDGAFGDQVAGDNVFTLATTVDAATPVGVVSLPATIGDSQGRSGTASISVDVRAINLFGDGFE